jgi:hypothetical protein
MYNYLITGFGDEYFKVPENGQIRDNSSSLEGYKSVITSKGSEDTMVIKTSLQALAN